MLDRVANFFQKVIVFLEAVRREAERNSGFGQHRWILGCVLPMHQRFERNVGSVFWRADFRRVGEVDGTDDRTLRFGDCFDATILVPVAQHDHVLQVKFTSESICSKVKQFIGCFNDCRVGFGIAQ